MKNQKLRVSIVIPVYNEERYLAACLEAIAVQSVPAHEVIVVDNNSSDRSVQVAKSYSFVRVIKEKKQGVVYARDTGFNAATGEIIGRIDADTVISPDWVEQVLTVFSNPLVGAATGRVQYQSVAAQKFVNRVDLFWRRRMARLLGREVALQGANMAIRREAWQNIRKAVCHQSGMHEDFDLAIHTNQAGYRVEFDERLVAGVHFRQASYKFKSFSHYALISPRTYRQHGLKSSRHMYEVVVFVIVFYWPIKWLYRGYSPVSHKFSISLALSPTSITRVNPATFVD